MKGLLLTLLLTAILFSCRQKPRDPMVAIQKFVLLQADSLDQDILALKKVIDADTVSWDSLAARQLFSNARIHYKQIEGIVEFHFPGVAEAFNGPALPEADDYDDKVILPSGFQVVEEMLFSQIDPAQYQRLRRELNLFVSMMPRLKGQLETNSWSAENIFEASRLEILRVISMGITGFDSPVAFHSLDEARFSLSGIKNTIIPFAGGVQDEELIKTLYAQFAKADEYLSSNQDFNAFNRGEFIVDFIRPLAKSIYDVQKSRGIPNNKWLSPLDMTQTNFANASSVQPMWFAPTYNREIPNQKEIISLGKLLFFDPVLSGNNSRACASCHQPGRAFTDGATKSLAFNSKERLERNAPTIINSGFQKSQFTDSRLQVLEDQITDVLSNKTEMHGQITDVANLLQRSDEYSELFATAFGKTTSPSITKERIQLAIATYIRSLNGLHSKVDQYLEGEKSALNQNELAGMNLFMGKAKCATCHFVPLFNGSIPPGYTETESEIIGVPSSPDTLNATIDPDLGKFQNFQRELHRNAFKIPTVRNVALTAPYMHNGVYSTLEAVVDFYNRGGGKGIGVKLSNQTLPPDPLRLTSKEKDQLIIFMRALTDTVNLTSIPGRLPTFNDEKLDRRKIGGDY